MGVRSFESDLRRRLLAFVVPTVLGVAIASVVVTWRALAAADEASARYKASSMLVALESELAEGDEPHAAATEVLNELDTEGVSASLYGADVRAASTKHAPSEEARSLSVGACTFYGDVGEYYRACRVSRGSHDGVAALRVTAHVNVVKTLAEAMLLVVLAALGATVWAARLAMRQPITDVRGLAAWSEHVAFEAVAAKAPALATEELRRLAASLDSLVERLTTALARERATSVYVAHELRTPLTSIRAELEALGGEAATRLVGDVDRLSRAIDAILLLAAPVDQSARGEVVNLADVARTLATPATAVEAPDEALIDANERLVELAVANLLENARVHAGAEAATIRVTRVPSGVRLAVVDDGPGVAPEMLAHLFDAHVRGAGSKGSGLGLALVRAVAERCDGDVDATPRAGTRGLEVGITFGRLIEWHD